MTGWLKHPKRTNRHLKRYARLFLILHTSQEIGTWMGCSWIRRAALDPKNSGHWINRFHRRNGH
jgi:hypothetical protein